MPNAKLLDQSSHLPQFRMPPSLSRAFPDNRVCAWILCSTNLLVHLRANVFSLLLQLHSTILKHNVIALPILKEWRKIMRGEARKDKKKVPSTWVITWGWGWGRQRSISERNIKGLQQHQPCPHTYSGSLVHRYILYYLLLCFIANVIYTLCKYQLFHFNKQ